jgi:hypothetical protein
MAYQLAMDRHAQNDYQLYVALTNSVDEDTKGKMQHEKNEFMTSPAGDVPNGMLYFKKLMMKAEVNALALQAIHDIDGIAPGWYCHGSECGGCERRRSHSGPRGQSGNFGHCGWFG